MRTICTSRLGQTHRATFWLTWKAWAITSALYLNPDNASKKERF